MPLVKLGNSVLRALARMLPQLSCHACFTITLTQAALFLHVSRLSPVFVSFSVTPFTTLHDPKPSDMLVRKFWQYVLSTDQLRHPQSVTGEGWWIE